MAARSLVETTHLPMAEIAARVGMHRTTLSKLKTRHGWRRRGPDGVVRHKERGVGPPFLPEIVAEARALIEGTTLSRNAVAKRLRVSSATLFRWARAHGWKRPPEAPAFLPPPRADGRARPDRYRSKRGRPYAADAVGKARLLLTGTLLSHQAIADRIGVGRTWVGRTLRRHGWERPPCPPDSRSGASIRRTAPLATEGDRRGRPYAPEVRREARQLWELTRLSTTIIAARIGVQAQTIALWARVEGWQRPRGRPGVRQLRGYFGMLKGGGG